LPTSSDPSQQDSYCGVGGILYTMLLLPTYKGRVFQAIDLPQLLPTLIVQLIHNVEGISLFTPISLVYARSLNNLDVISAGQKEVSDQRETFIQQWTNHG